MVDKMTDTHKGDVLSLITILLSASIIFMLTHRPEPCSTMGWKPISETVNKVKHQIVYQCVVK